MSNDSNTKTRPTHRIYSVTKNGDSKANWQEIGAAWPHKDGKGFNLKFTARPLDGAEIVLREPKGQEGGRSMSALPLRRYRVLGVETRTLRTFLDAKSSAEAHTQAVELWDQEGDEAFESMECNFDVVFVEKEPR